VGAREAREEYDGFGDAGFRVMLRAMSESDQQSAPLRELIIEDVPEPLASRLCNLARRWVPPTVRSRQIKELFWGGENLSHLATKLFTDQKGRLLKLECLIPEEHNRDTTKLFRSDALHGQTLHGKTKDGLTFHAQKAYWESTLNFSLVTIQGYHWNLRPENQPTNFTGRLNRSASTVARPADVRPAILVVSSHHSK
jgi:hypothetical protein